ncbi:MAG: hypothetical protein EOP85_15870 [Verrucomicrobiaceae bacterium]|nr:MAG: hypothetical protein EOP85_15870 [Verrucomicrobiaceae bacterium]
MAVQAAPVSQLSRSVKKYGGFKPGYKFTLRVTDKDVVKPFGDVPNEVPSFREGAKINFKIGPKGQLTAREGVWINFEDGSKDGNDYERIGSRPTKLTSYAYIDKNGSGKAAKGEMIFRITSFDNVLPVSYEVRYKLKK